MITLHIDSIKPHDIYQHIKSTSSDVYQFINGDADITIVALEDPSSERRVSSYLNQGRKIFVYFEHISSLVEVPAHVYASDNMLGVLTHSSDSVTRAREYLPKKKCFYFPVGVPEQDADKIKERLRSEHPLTFLFWGSFDDRQHGNFKGRGGIAADELFIKVRQEIDCKLIIRSPMRLRCQDLFPDDVTSMEAYVDQGKLDELHMQSDILLLPSIQAHFASIPIAMSFGLPVVGNYNWGWVEHVANGYNGILENYTTRGEVCGERQHIDYNYINLVSARIVELAKDRDALIRMSLNALFTHAADHHIRHYPKLLGEILADL